MVQYQKQFQVNILRTCLFHVATLGCEPWAISQSLNVIGCFSFSLEVEVNLVLWIKFQLQEKETVNIQIR